MNLPLADLVLITHVAFVAFVLVGLLLILLGGMLGWGWVRNPWFRSLHLAGIGLVVVQVWFGDDGDAGVLRIGGNLVNDGERSYGEAVLQTATQ